MNVRRDGSIVRSCLAIMLIALLPISIGAQAVQRQPVVELALRERLQQAVTAAQTALAAVDVKKFDSRVRERRTNRGVERAGARSAASHPDSR